MSTTEQPQPLTARVVVRRGRWDTPVVLVGVDGRAWPLTHRVFATSPEGVEAATALGREAAASLQVPLELPEVTP